MLIPQAIVQASNSAGGMTMIDSSVLGSADVFDFNNIPGTYSHLLLILQLRTTANSGATPRMTLNGDSGANYYRTKTTTTNATVSGSTGTGESDASITATSLPGATDTAGRAGLVCVDIINYTGTTFHKEWFSRLHSAPSNSAAVNAVGVAGGTWADTSAITRIQVNPSSGSTFETGSAAWLYGI